MMNLICDQNDIVVDLATEKENLSCGYTFPGHKIYENIKLDEIMIGDIFKDGVLAKNEQLRFDVMQKANDEAKITAEIRLAALERLKTRGELPAEYE